MSLAYLPINEVVTGFQLIWDTVDVVIPNDIEQALFDLMIQYFTHTWMTNINSWRLAN